ncbi:hypothetical protein QBC36DRAFT_23401 [Triangularia setosa]|uniref:Uncharacterized protein n=1 Tax=Triangularia setosa TaxID=2587417 RepID=A0AAN7ACE8_9PEZI|nr:hypothetical protein QBC36DRAFT_23401 [Podospora setosa]
MVGASAAISTGEPVPFLTQPIPSSKDATPSAAAADVDEKKTKKRSLFGFGKKKVEDVTKSSSKTDASSSVSQTTTSPMRRTAASPIRTEHLHYTPSSPSRPFASSPRLSSPAGSQIFERNVQESTAGALPTSPAIPSHIQTENYIPPVLDASSEAITDTHLNPDLVEIITHTSHQPAAVAVTGGGGGGIGVYSEPTWVDELAAFSLDRGSNAINPDSASNYGSLDTTDVRRLSFISFADVVQAEQQSFGGVAGSRESMHIPGLTSLTSLNNNTNRSPSPIRSPVSSSAGDPGSKSGSVKGLDLSPARKPLGSPTSLMGHSIPPLGLGGPAGGPTVSGELSIETMSQALRRTGSGDLRGGLVGGGLGASLPQSPI